ncbi:YdcF family protein [Thalassospira mesophila]|uniref:YdcF family protein n=1 Tax=Thalassospira mesophila TaxID=1293891 RepID=UPI001302E8AC|nr:YdcF family protein [Thalassospira mesophila]
MTLGFATALVLVLFKATRRAAHALLVVIAMICVGVTVCPVGQYGVQILEDRFPRPTLESIHGENIAGIIVLGGAVDGEQYIERGLVEYNGSADRIFGMLQLANHYPAIPVIYSGADGALVARGFNEADAVQADMIARGINATNIVYENQSRNTAENAALSYQLVIKNWPERAQGKWLLITSARHMPRAMGVFRQYGWSIIAWPVDYIAPAHRHLTDINVSHSIKMLDNALKEFAGLTAYYWTGRTSTWFPAP